MSPSKSEKVENRGQYKEIFTGPKGFDRKSEEEGTEDQPKATVCFLTCKSMHLLTNFKVSALSPYVGPFSEVPAS